MKKHIFLSLIWLLVFGGAINASAQKCIDKKTQDIIIAVKQGCRPLPDVYLSKECIEKQLGVFAAGASYLVPKDVLDKYGRKLLGRADGQFVMAKVQMDKLLGTPNVSIAFIEKELGIPAGAWSGKTLCRIDISDPKALDLRLPSGNEAGANSLWLPGGYLPTGYSEAVVNPIPEGKYTETVLSIK